MKILALISFAISVNLFSISHCLAIKVPAYVPEDDVKKKDSSLNVVNNTNYDVEHMIYWTCDYMGIKNVTICVANQPDSFEKDGMLVKHDDLYFIYLKEKLVSVNIVIIHELIHIKQYEEQDLLKINSYTVNYKGDEINLNTVEYFQRSFEVDAHSEDSGILRKYFKYKKGLRGDFRKQDHEPENDMALVSN